MYKSKVKLFLLIMLILALMTTFLAACSGKTPTEIDEEDNVKPAASITVNNALDMIYNGLVDGGNTLKNAPSKYVETAYTIYTSTINFTITYKAYYAENIPDSLFYVKVFDNKQNIDRVTFYYDSKDLYVMSGDSQKVISDFSSTMMFNIFYTAVTSLDMTENFYGGEVAKIFNRNNEDLNLSLLMSINNLSYIRVDENKESLEIKDLDLSIINDVVGANMDLYLNDIGDKFDVLTQKYLDFKLSRLLESRFAYIFADLINIQLEDSVAKTTIWKASGTMRDGSKYFVTADMTYDFTTNIVEEGSKFVKSKFNEVSLGKNEFEGTILIPAISDECFDMQVVTDLNSQNNALNKMTIRILDAQKNDFIGAYYRDQIMYLDISGLYSWTGGTVDLEAMHFPKVYFDGIDLTSLMTAGYNDLLKAVLIFIDKEKGGINSDNEELYSIIMENFTSDNKNNIYYTITEELIQKIRENDKSVMTMISELLKVDQTKLESYIGADFFTDAKLVISYNLDSGKIGIALYKKTELIFQIYLDRKPFTSINFPSDTTLSSYAYSKLLLPDVTTLEFEAELRVGNAKSETDLSKFLGAMVGDITGKNTPQKLKGNERLYISGAISESITVNSEGQSIVNNIVKANVFKKLNGMGEAIKLFSIYTNIANPNIMLVDYYLPVGNYANTSPIGLKFKINKEVLKTAFNELLGENNIFNESSAFGILEMLLNTKNSYSTVTKADGYINFSIMVDSTSDPVFQLIGVKDTNASIKARIRFVSIDLSAIIPANYCTPNVEGLTNVTVESIYSENSKWKDKVNVYFDGIKVVMIPNYSSESTNIVTGQSTYNPLANLFGKDITYGIEIISQNGTYKIDSLVSNKIIIDPSYNKELPILVDVLYDNGQTGKLKCSIANFDSNNITKAGYNLSGFAQIFTQDMESNLTIGNNSIMEKSFVVYILVNNRNILADNYVGLTPIMGEIQIDPYTYALKKLDNNNYNPIIEAIVKQNLEIKFNNVYGQKEYIDGDEMLMMDLVYDMEGVNRFYLSNLPLVWEMDESLITWQGAVTYAYAYFGDRVNGYASKIAIKVSILAQEIDYVQIDEEESGKYTIDYLINASYTLPVQTSESHYVRVYFKGMIDKFRVVGVRGETTDEEYYNNYIPVQLLWAGAESIKTKINFNGTATLFGTSNETTASFGENLFVGVQTVKLQVVVPERYMSDADDVTIGVNLVTSYIIDEFGSITAPTATLRISKAKFKLEDDFFAPFEINPYDASAYLPSNIYLEVNKSYGSNSAKITKSYPVRWKTTNRLGVELNILKEKNGKFYLANPVTQKKDLVVYGNIGDGNGEIWVVMYITNLASELQSVTYFMDYSYNSYSPDDGLPVEIYKENTYYINNQITRVRTLYNVAWLSTNMNDQELGIISIGQGNKFYLNVGAVLKNVDLVVYGKASNDLGESFWVMMNIIVSDLNVQSITYMGLETDTTVITIDPYKPYSLPTGFVAVLESGAEIIVKNIMWYINNGVDDNWYPAIYGAGCQRDMYGSDNKFIFSRAGGTYFARYIIEGGGAIISQELILEINVSKRTVVSNLIEIYNNSANMPVNGYIDINYYSIESTQLLNRLNAIKSGSPYNYVGVYFDEAKSEGIYDRFTLKVDWCNAQVGETNYEHSINKLIYMLSHPEAGFEMTLIGKIGEGTINEQELVIAFAFSSLEIEKISFGRVKKMADGTSPVLEMDQQNSLYQIEFSEMFNSQENMNVLRINILKVFALTVPNQSNQEKYASPYQYINYLLSNVKLYYKNGNVENAVPVLNYLGITENEFNGMVLGLTQSVGTISLTEILLDKLSAGSAIDTIKVIITAKVDERLTNDLAITAELYNEDSTEKYGEAYPLPTFIDVIYRYSGLVKYDVSTWTVGSTSRNLLNVDSTNSIPVRLIDTLRTSGTSEGSFYNFYYNLPTEKQDLFLQIYIPKKNINKTFYSAEGETNLYNIVNGTINISNPYLYYVAGSEYGLNEKLIPTTILATITAQNYSSTDINTHYVDWTFISGVFTESMFRNGCNRVLFATATLKAYYDLSRRNDLVNVGQTQTIELYITVSPMDFYGISYQKMSVIEGLDSSSNIKLNTITLDPYNDLMNYNGTLNLPTNGLNVYFNNLGESYAFSNVTFRLIDDTNRPRDTITTITYDQYGHTLNYDYLHNPGKLTLRMYIPGYAYDESDYNSGILLYVLIFRRVVEDVTLPNIATNELGAISLIDLPALYFIDPYNSATYPLPIKASIKFEESTEFNIQKIVKWEFFNENTNTWVSLNDSDLFYSQESTAYQNIQYGYFKNTEQAFSGGNYRLRGFIRVGEGAGGIVGQQSFEVVVIVLNRKLIASYNTTKAYSDPLGGILADIPSGLSQNMFVDYDKNYIGLINEEYYYSNWSTPVLPEISWSRYISDDEIASIGGFDTTINGYVASANANTEYLYSFYRQEVTAEYDLLIKALMWDGYFNKDGNPLVNYSTQAASKLLELKEELENEVIFATYNLVKNKLNNSTLELDRENGSYLVNGLIISMSEKTGYNPTEYLNRLSVELFNELSEEYARWVANGKKEIERNKNIVIFIEWENIYSLFKSKDATTSSDLSEYQKLKVLKYDKLNAEGNNKFSSSDREYNAKLKTKISSGLTIYVNKEIYLRLFDRVTLAERQRMTGILGQTTESAALISAALQTYMSVKWKTLSSYGESAYADISAPAMSFEDIYKIDDVMTTQAITELLFNIYDSNALDDKVLAEFIISYADYYRPYIEQAMASAWDNYRNTVKDQSITEFANRIIRETVNSIVPTYVDIGGNTHKVNDFDYNSYLPTNATNVTYWNQIYTFKHNNATVHIDALTGTSEQKWNQLYNAHLINGEQDMVIIMNNILASIPGTVTDTYAAALSNYREKLIILATEDMDLVYSVAEQKANANIVESISSGSSLFSGLAFDAQQSFSYMYGNLADTAFDLFYGSYVNDAETYSGIKIKYEESFNSNKRFALHYYLYSSDAMISTSIRTRAQEIFFFVLQGSSAFDAMYENATKIGLTKARIDSYLLVMSADITSYSNIFSEVQFASFKKAKYFLQMKRNYGGGESFATYMNDWYEASLLTVKDKAYNDLYNAYVRYDEDNASSNAINLDSKKIANSNITLNAFNLLVETYKQKGIAKTSFTQDKDIFVNQNIYTVAEIIYNELMNSPDFAYKNYLEVDENSILVCKDSAVKYYYINAANNEQKAIIDYERAFSSNDDSLVYNILLGRYDVDKKFSDGLINSYYYQILINMLQSVELDINANTNVTGNESQYIYYSNIIKNMILAGCENTILGTLKPSQNTLLSNYAKTDYLNYLYTNAINAYTQKINANKLIIGKNYYIELYDILYVESKLALDEILTSIYAAYVSSGHMSENEGIIYNAFNILGNNLVAKELVNLFNAITEIENEMALSQYYDTLSLFTINVDYDAMLTDIYTAISNSYFLVYDAASNLEKDLIDNLIDKNLFGKTSSIEGHLEEIVTTYKNLKLTDAGDIQTLITNIIIAWEAISIESYGNELDKEIISSIRKQIKQNLYTELHSIDTGRINFYTVVALLKVIREYTNSIKLFDRDLYTREYLTSGDTGSLESTIKYQLVTALKNVLSNNGYSIAFSLINKRVEAYQYDFVISNTNATELYLEYQEKIITKLLKTSSASTITALQSGGSVTVYSYYNYIYTSVIVDGGTANPNNIGMLPLSYYLTFIDGTNSYSDVSYQKAFNAMGNERVVTLVFFVSDNIEKASGTTPIEERRRHVLTLDKIKLVNNNESSQVDAIYITNQNKQTSANIFKKDGIVYKFVQMNISYIDYFNNSNVNNIVDYTEKNKITIDPLYPNLPTKVQAYATLTENNMVKDVGMVDVTYSNEFYENNYSGGTGEYAVTLRDSRGNTNTLVINVTYLNRKVEKMFAIDAFYGGGKVTASDVENTYFIGYYNLYNEVANSNILLVNPINDAVLDTYNKKFILPTTLGVSFANGDKAIYTNVVWDMAQISYTLAAQNNKLLRIKSYDIEDTINDVITKVEFDYTGSGSVRISILDASREVISFKDYENAPSYENWNVKFQSINQSITTVDYFVGDNLIRLGTMINNNYIDVLSSTLMFNPYDIIYPKTVAVNFGDGTTIELNPNWRLEPGSEGTYKLKDILLGAAQDRMVVAIFTYLGYTIRFRFVTQDIEIEDVDSEHGEYIDGGILYLVAGTESAYDQLQKNYSYMYYDFSEVINEQNWQKVPISFTELEIGRIVTSSPRIYEGENAIKGVLGWDKRNYPDINFSPNIKFTVIVIEPKLYSYMNGNNVNTYVINDYFSTPYDNNYQKKKDVNEPNTIGNYFIQLGANRELDTYFTISATETIYKIVDAKVNFKVSYTMSTTNSRLAFLPGGDRTISFEISLRLSPYLYTAVSNLELLHTKTSSQIGYFTWTTVPTNSVDYVPAIHWPLGTVLKASEMPWARDIVTGNEMPLMWDLNDVNINLATSEGYRVRGYYYDASSTWKYLELTIYIDKVDKKTNILNNLGGNYAINTLYNGRYYKLPININHSTLKFLRSNGTSEYLNIENYLIEYKLASENITAFSTTNYPINAGVYEIRVRINDYNVFGEIIFTLTIRAVTIDSGEIVFMGDEQSLTNIITYTYDAKNHALVVASGLPSVNIDNWFASINEKEAMINVYSAQGYSETAAKTRAYNDLYGRVTIATRRYLDNEIAKIRRESGVTDLAVLNATLFDRLTPNMAICEVVYTITYRNSNDEVLATAPVDVGTYTVLFEVTALNNSGNYTFSTDRVSRRITILKPDVVYSILTNTIVYNGKKQNPLINNLHDVSGILPGGVVVTYNYSYTESGITKYATNGITNVGSYYCDITVDGGNNYPSMNIPTSVIYLVPKDLHIDLSDISMQYLSNVADVGEFVNFSGLVGTDKAREFGLVVTETEVKSYYTLGIYEAYILGFKLNADSSDIYTSFDLGITYDYNNKSYYKLSLKNANLAGSLYKEVDDEGNYIYIDLINKFRNYAIYIVTAGEYEIRAEQDAIVIADDDELQAAIAGITENQSIKLYLSPGEYSAITLNVNADVSIVGCYDFNKNILTKIKGITINAGVLTLKIIKFEAQSVGKVSISINNNANSIGIYDCLFDGLNKEYAVAIKTGTNYVDKIYMVGTTIHNYHRGIELVNGNLELTQSIFNNNKFGITVQSKQADLRITQINFNNNDVALLSSNENVTILYNSFDCNRIAVTIPSSNLDTEIIANNTFTNTNGTNLDHNV